MAIKFLRRNWTKASRLGRGRKKKQVWRAAKGRHNKMRNKMKGYPAIVEVGHKKEKKENKVVLIYNLKDLKKIEKKNKEIIIGKVGNKKREEIIKYAKENKIKIKNLNKKENKK